MTLVKARSRGINLADNFTFTGTVSGAGGNTPSFLAYLTANQTITNNSYTKINLNGEY